MSFGNVEQGWGGQNESEGMERLLECQMEAGG